MVTWLDSLLGLETSLEQVLVHWMPVHALPRFNLFRREGTVRYDPIVFENSLEVCDFVEVVSIDTTSQEQQDIGSSCEKIKSHCTDYSQSEVSEQQSKVKLENCVAQ